MAKVADFFSLLFEVFIGMHTMMFDLIGNFDWSNRLFGFGYAISERIIGIFGLVVILAFDLLVLYGIYLLIRRISIILRTKKTVRRHIIGTITDKKYVAPHTIFVSTGKVTSPIVCSAVYNVCVKYLEVSKVFNNKDLFNQYEKNDCISLILVTRLGRDDKVVEQTLELPE